MTTAGNGGHDNGPNADIIIIGGGIAGLWLHVHLNDLGYSCLLIERDALGGGQTLASQGMIHGGIKYTLAGATTGASEAIADMPDLWRACLRGEGPVDLRHASLLSGDYFMFSDGSATSKLTGFFGSRALRGRVTAVPPGERPPALDHEGFRGNVYRLQDIVLDAVSLVTALRDQYPDRICRADVVPDMAGNRLEGLTTACGQTLTARHYLLCAGAGNEALLDAMKMTSVSTQRRPLKQVYVASAKLPDLYAHAVSLRAGSKPRMTITTHHRDDGMPVWYLGGAIAEDGAAMGDEALIARTRTELGALFPWLDLGDARYALLPIDRAEPGQAEKQRPDTPFAKRVGNIQVCWPTKLTLTPALANDVIRQLDPEPTGALVLPNLPQPDIAPPPWETLDFHA